MSQEQLSFETCQEIGHISPESAMVYAFGKIYNPDSFAQRFKTHFLSRKEALHYRLKIKANHPSITDMMEWLWRKDSRCLQLERKRFIMPVGGGRFYRLEDKHGVVEDNIAANSLIEAYAEAVKIIMNEQK